MVNPMDFVSILVSGLGVAISLYALRQAKSARQMAQSVIDRGNEHEDSQILRDLIAILNSAKDAALRNQKTASRVAKAGGPTQKRDIDRLQEAQDALRTKLPPSWSNEQRETAESAANDIDLALQQIGMGATANRDGWKDALSTLQALIPTMQRELRAIKSRLMSP